MVLKGLARKANERFASAREMTLAIEAALRVASALEIGSWVTATAGPVLQTRDDAIPASVTGAGWAILVETPPEDAP